MISVDGTLLMETRSNGLKTTLDLTGFANGVYLIQMDNSSTKRLVLNN